MPRGPKLDIPGTLRHVMVRGIDRQDIFLSNADRNGRIGADEARQVTASIQAERFERGQAGRAGDDQKGVGSEVLLVITDVPDLRPLRRYVIENADKTATIIYRLPSAVFKPYGSAKLDAMARELDPVFEKIVRDAAGK